MTDDLCFTLYARAEQLKQLFWFITDQNKCACKVIKKSTLLLCSTVRSAPKIFNAVADALEWCIAKEGVTHVFHYLDDFVVIGPPQSETCKANLHKLQLVCSKLGVPLALEKQEGPATSLEFLGIIINTIKGELALPADKLQRLLTMVDAWLTKKVCTPRELESLIGTLHHACKVIKPGRSFLRRAIALLSVASKRHHHIRLNSEFRSDMMWWKVFASHWNGTSLLVRTGPPDVMFTSDASGSWGCGAWSQQHWFQLQWDDSIQSKHISVKELVPIVIAILHCKNDVVNITTKK